MVATRRLPMGRWMRRWSAGAVALVALAAHTTLGPGGELPPHHPRPELGLGSSTSPATGRHQARGIEVGRAAEIPRPAPTGRRLFPGRPPGPGVTSWLELANPGAGAVSVTVGAAGGTTTPLVLESRASRRLPISAAETPVELTSGGPLEAVEVTSAYGSISTFGGLAETAAATRQAFSWYDSISMSSDILVLNPQAGPAHVIVSIDGRPLWQGLVGAGQAARASFAGVSAGPAVISSDVPVLASQQTALGDSRWEVAAVPIDDLAADSWYAWYGGEDAFSTVHLANLGWTTTQVAVLIQEAEAWSGSLGGGESRVLAFPGLTGGPLHVLARTPVLASLRTVRQRPTPSFEERPLKPTSEAAVDQRWPGYGQAAEGTNQQLHLISATGRPATVTIANEQGTFWKGAVAALSGTHIELPPAESGPLRVTSTAPLLAWRNLSYASPRPPPGGYGFTLTFDDCGPPDVMREMIAIVAEKQIPAIFFPTGRCRDSNPWLVPEIQARGFQACNHTYSHTPLTNVAGPAFDYEIANGVDTGCRLLRPPFGAWDGPRGRVAQRAQQLGYQIFLWDLDTGDWAGSSADAMLARIRGRQGVVLAHLGGAHTLEMLRRL